MAQLDNGKKRKEAPQMPDAKSPNLNAQSDSVKAPKPEALQVPDAKSPSFNVRNESAVPSEENIEQAEQGDKGGITFPEGALTFGDKSAVEGFKGDGKQLTPSEQKKFDEMMSREVKIGGRKMTRLEVVEGMAKGELDEDAMKLNQREQEYLKWLKKNLIDLLKAIQAAGIQGKHEL